MGKISITKFRNGLKDSMGSITTIAKVCQVERLTVYRLLEKHPKLKNELEDEKNRIIDLAEKNIKLMALKSNFKALKFFLERKGGWVLKQELEVKSDNKHKIDLSKYHKYVKGEKESGTNSTGSNTEGHK